MNPRAIVFRPPGRAGPAGKDIETTNGTNRPAWPSAATKTDPLAKTQRAPRRQGDGGLPLGVLGVFARDNSWLESIG